MQPTAVLAVLVQPAATQNYKQAPGIKKGGLHFCRRPSFSVQGKCSIRRALVYAPDLCFFWLDRDPQCFA